MMILARRREYKTGYKKHYAAYKYLKKNNDSLISRCLLLIYSAECGLKCILLQNWRIDSPKEIIENEEDDRKGKIKTHNLEKILIELGQTKFQFPKLTTENGQSVNSDTYHQMFRYGIELKEKDKKKIKECEDELLKIIDYIEEEIN